MHFHNLNLNYLVALDALLTEKNVTRASKRVHLSQSALSVILGQLRKYFQNELLVASGRTMLLTPLAQSLAQPVRESLLQIQHTITSRVGFDPATSRRIFSLAISDYVGVVLMPQALRVAAQQAPGVTFKFLSMDGPIDNQLANGEIDLIIRPMQTARPAHSQEMLFSDNYSCVVWAGNSLVRRRLSLKKYLELGHVASSAGGQPVYFEQWFEAQYGGVRRIEIAASTFETTCRYVVGTDRVATVLTKLARLCAEHMPLRILRAPFPAPRITEVTEWNRYQDNDPGHAWLRGLLQRAADGLPRAPKTPPPCENPPRHAHSLGASSQR